jgi:probable phosphoglycerate mutase
MRPDITIYFVRHGETDWNAQSRYQGQHDIPMNDTGRAQARRNGAALRAALPDPLPRADALAFVASPMLRTRETMALLRAELGMGMDGVAFDDRLREMHYGHWEGQLAADLPQIDPDGVAARARDWWTWRPRGGESYEDLTARVGAWLATVDRDTVVASHGGVSRALRGLVVPVDRAEVPRLPVPQDRVLVLRRGAMSWL